MGGTDEVETDWHRVMAVGDLLENDMVGVQVERNDVLLVNHAGEVVGFEDRCPHEETLLSQGELDGSTLTCHAHLWEFEIPSGIGIDPDDCRLTPIPVRVVEGMIEVRVPTR